MENLTSVLLFRDIWPDMNTDEDKVALTESILRDLIADVDEVISILKSPT